MKMLTCKVSVTLHLKGEDLVRRELINGGGWAIHVGICCQLGCVFLYQFLGDIRRQSETYV